MPSLSFLVSETSGLPRQAEPVAVTAGFYREDFPDPRFLELLDEDGQPVNFQVADLHSAPSTGPKTRPARHCCVHFLADLPVGGQRKYELKIQDTGAAYHSTVADTGPKNLLCTDLKIAGKGLSLCIENRYLVILLDPGSGRIYSVRNKSAGVTFTSPATPQWNTRRLDPNRECPALFSWDTPPKVTFERGPIFFELNRSGSPRCFPEMIVHLTYRVYAQSPWLWVRTIVEILEDVPLACLRHDELAFREKSFTHFAWSSGAQQAKARLLEDLPAGSSASHLARVGAAPPWTGFFHPEQGYGVARLHLSSMNLNRLGRPLRILDPSIHLMRSQELRSLYWVRPFIDSPRQDQLIVATEGSLYAEEGAIHFPAVPSPAPDATHNAQQLYEQLHGTWAQLKHPLEVEREG